MILTNEAQLYLKRIRSILRELNIDPKLNEAEYGSLMDEVENEVAMARDDMENK